jgi:hypothetical protein
MVAPGETAAAAVVELGNRSYGRFPTWAAALGLSGRSLAVLAAIVHRNNARLLTRRISGGKDMGLSP